MNKIVIPSVFLLAVLAFFATTSELWVECNRATGATRTKTRRALFFTSPWEERSTWVSERANQLGINTEADWQQISHDSESWFSRIYGCSRAPASFQLISIDLDSLAEEQQDQFVRTFVAASEESREEMIKKLINGS